MSPRYRSLACLLLAGVCLGTAACSFAFAQGRGGGMGGGGRMGGGFPSGARNPGEMGDIETSRGEGSGGVRGGLKLAPPGRWWNEKSFVKSLKLRPDQQTRMDSIFAQNRTVLLNSYLNVQQAEGRMMELAKSPNTDEAALSAQIDRVAQARADLGKAYTHLQMQLRKEMDPDQLAKLDQQR
jgi:Spy/CpxP family protein refolding chaperone